LRAIVPTAKNVPLAWKNLTHDPVRLALYTAGIGFAVVLMGVQYGIMNAMLDSNTVLLDRLNGELVLVNPTKASLLFREGVNRRRLEQAAGVAGVAGVDAVYLEYQLGEVRHTAADPRERTQTRRARIIGVDPNARAIKLPEVSDADWARLNVPGTALYDRKSRPHPDQANHPGESVFGPLADGIRTELVGRNLMLVGSGFELGFDFGTDGTFIVSDRTFAEWVRRPFTAPGVDPLAEADLGVVRLQPGADRTRVHRDLQALFAPDGDADVLTRDGIIAREKWFWWTNTPIGFAFGAGVLLGFVVGMVICYQILATDVADHASEYATLKAIGYPNRYLSQVVLQEAVILAALGFAVGLPATLGLYFVLSDWTGLPMHLTLGRGGLILVLTFVMCAGSGLLAVRKVKKVDPADVF
jgi:putative ABC transport system permease protein